ncbi:hypothetical protein D3C80_969420 [compost metagenome]
MATRNTGIRLAESLEQPRLIPLRDTNAGIADLHLNLELVIADRPLFDQNVNVSVFGKFNRVPHQISDHLLETQRIADDIIWYVIFDVQRQLKTFVVRGVRKQRHDFIQGAAQRERNAFEDQFARFQLGEIKHVVNDRQQIIRRALNGMQMVALGRVELRF